MQQYDEEEFQQSGGGWWIQKIGIAVYMAIIVAYAWQTLELVNWLFPADNWFMKIVTVFVCDGCATGYAMAEMFYRFKVRRSQQFVFGMWIVTFIFSTAATIIQMYLSSTHNIPHAIDAGVVTIAYGVIIVAFVVNIVAITVIIRMEHNASLPVRRYLDDPKRRKQSPAPMLGQSPPQQSIMSSSASVPDAITGQWQIVETGPLASPSLNSQARQSNGKHGQNPNEW